MPDAETHVPIPMLIGDLSVALSGGRVKLYSERRFHERTQRRWFWPNSLSCSKLHPDVLDVLAAMGRPLWLEVGFGPYSPLPLARPLSVRKVLAVDCRPWARQLFAFAHHPRVWLFQRSLALEFGRVPDVRLFGDLRRYVGRIECWQQAAVALYLLGAGGGQCLPFPTAEASIVYMPGTAQTTVPRSDEWAMYPVQITADTHEAVRHFLRYAKPVYKHLHVHFNTPTDSRLLAYLHQRSTTHGLSWSAITDRQTAAEARCMCASIAGCCMAMGADDAVGLPHEILWRPS